jgi:hypothetical protein
LVGLLSMKHYLVNSAAIIVLSIYRLEKLTDTHMLTSAQFFPALASMHLGAQRTVLSERHTTDVSEQLSDLKLARMIAASDLH